MTVPCTASPDLQEGAPAVLLFETAAAHATRAVPVVGPEASVDRVVQGLLGQRFESVTDIAVCVGQRLLGVVPLEKMLAPAPGTPVEELMD